MSCEALETEPRHFLVSRRPTAEATAVENHRVDGHARTADTLACKERRNRLWRVDSAQREVRREPPGFRCETNTSGRAFRNCRELGQTLTALADPKPENACTPRVGESSKLAETNHERLTTNRRRQT